MSFQRVEDGVVCDADLIIKSIHQFANLFMKQKMAPDWLVSCMTFLTLREDEQEEEEIIRKTTKIHNWT